MRMPRKCDAKDKIIKDAAAAAALCLVEYLPILPDKELLAVVLYDAIECAVILDRRERVAFSLN